MKTTWAATSKACKIIRIGRGGEGGSNPEFWTAGEGNNSRRRRGGGVDVGGGAPTGRQPYVFFLLPLLRKKWEAAFAFYLFPSLRSRPFSRPVSLSSFCHMHMYPRSSCLDLWPGSPPLSPHVRPSMCLCPAVAGSHLVRSAPHWSLLCPPSVFFPVLPSNFQVRVLFIIISIIVFFFPSMSLFFLGTHHTRPR